jgi:hypothetical protein
MTKQEVAWLIALAAAYDERTINKSVIEAWALALFPDVTYEQAKTAIIRWYQQHDPHRERISVATLNQLARQVPKAHHGAPGETTCRKCSGVHYPHEPCSALMNLQEYGVERFIREFNGARAAKGLEPLSSRVVKRIMARNGVTVPADDTEGF